ncbi:hypothetical protein EVAR_72787_1 [Eumeta japonica]|uniref:Uncharacterized protein n=1 Tax=Eumeta variegata TaxID=151549 RepID=A0A4C1TEX2_EUMVA|nr:hypothetical protein EVAR_72787_1 [Eumeta japonica]
MSSSTNLSNINPYSVVSANENECEKTTDKPTAKRLESASITGRKPLAAAMLQNSEQQLIGGTGLIASVPVSQQQQLESLMKPKDTLEYIIKFPTPQYRNEQRTSLLFWTSKKLMTLNLYNDTHVPIVMLLASGLSGSLFNEIFKNIRR